MAKALGGQGDGEARGRGAGFEMAAPVNVLERKGVVTQRKILDEVRRLRDRAAKAR